ncbi:MAG: DUF3791 domain-containing protein [Bacteroidales bacterium]|jgi:hypothetical protein|nr:DUF3791 domain-containing protein [Bacteroidales bacterium]
MHNDVDFEMLPFVMKELVAMVVEKKSLPLENALHYIYSSKMYKTLISKETKMWYLSTLSLYDLLEKEKEEKRSYCDEKVLLFEMFCIENFRAKKNLSAEDALLLFSNYDVFSFLEDTFEMLHTQDRDYILDSITTYIKGKKK